MSLRSSFSLATCLLLAAVSAAPDAETGDAEQKAVLATVQLVLDGWRAGDPSKLETALHPEFREVTLHLFDKKWEFASVTRDKLIGITSKVHWDDVLLDPVVHVDGNIAVVWSHYRFRTPYTENGVFHDDAHCGIETFQLYKTDAGWKIVNFADTHIDGCPAH
jgi:hypothetical protein